jgi:glycosyltransferase involved in cell wall biosynthesis
LDIRVLHIIPSLNKGGAERITLDICKELSLRSDCEVLLVLMRDDRSYEIPSHLHYKVTSSRVKLSVWKKNCYQLTDLNLIITSFQPTIVHSHLFEAELLSRGLLKKGVTYITHVHDNITQFSPFQTKATLKRKIADYYERFWIFKRYSKVKNQFISISSDTTRYLEAVLPTSFKETIFPLSNAIDYDRFYSDQPRSLPNGKLRLISIGSLVPKKNQLLLIEIATLLKSTDIDFELLILGEGPDRPQLEEEIAVQGLTGMVQLMGNVHDVPFYLHQANLFIHPAIYEPFGLVLLEAMAAGVPVVSLDGGGNRDILVDGKNGFLISENDANSFVEKIQYLYSHPHQYRIMSEFAQSFAKQYDISIYIDQLMEFYYQCLVKK